MKSVIRRICHCPTKVLSFLLLMMICFFGAAQDALAETTGVDITLERYREHQGYATHSSFAEDMEFDAAGNEYQLRVVYRSGAVAEVVDLNPGSGTQNFTLQAKSNLFVTKYNAAGEYVSSYYLAYSPVVSGGFAMLNMKLEVSSQGIYVFGDLYASPLTVYTTSSTTSLAVGQSLSNPVGVLLRYGADMSYSGANAVDNLDINDLKVNPNGGFYLATAIQGTVDVDFMTGGTTSYSLTNSPRTDGVFASYAANGSLNFAYRYNSVSAAAGSDVAIDQLRVSNDRVYVLLAFNSNTTPTSVDLNPTSGTDSRMLHEHDPAIIAFDHLGSYLWSHVVSSSDLYGSYPFVDDEMVSSFDIAADGSVYVGMYSDSDAVKIGSTTYAKNITGQNNVYESFLYKISPSGTTVWSKYFPSMSSNSTSIFNVKQEPESGRVVVLIRVNTGGISIDGTTYTNPYTVRRHLFVVFDSDGSVESADFMPVTGTTSDFTWDEMNANSIKMYTANGTTLLYVQNDMEAANSQVNLDFTGNTSGNIVTLNDYIYYQLFYRLTPIIQNTVSSAPSGSSISQPVPQPPGCSSTPPGLKVPWIYGAVPLSSTSVRLYVAPGDQPFNSYTFTYDVLSGGQQWGVADAPYENKWTWDFHELRPNTTYYFKMRAGNGCAPGGWSNEVMVTTNPSSPVNNDASSLSASPEVLGETEELKTLETDQELQSPVPKTSEASPQKSTVGPQESLESPTNTASSLVSRYGLIGIPAVLLLVVVGYIFKRTFF